DEHEGGAAPDAGGTGPESGIDWLHTNAVNYEPELDLIALSSARLSEIWIVDHSTTTREAAGHTGGRYGPGGGLLWRWGNPRNHGAGTEGDRRLFAQHDVQWIPAGCPGAGHLLVFDNGTLRPGGGGSAVLELVLPFVPGRGFALHDGVFGPEQ